MSQVPFGQRVAMTPQASDVTAITAPRDNEDNGPNLGLMIAAGLIAGFIIAAIECL